MTRTSRWRAASAVQSGGSAPRQRAPLTGNRDDALTHSRRRLAAATTFDQTSRSNLMRSRTSGPISPTGTVSIRRKRSAMSGIFAARPALRAPEFLRSAREAVLARAVLEKLRFRDVRDYVRPYSRKRRKADIVRRRICAHSTKSLRDSGGCGLGLSSVPRDSRGDCLEHAVPMHPSHTSRTATSLKTKIIKSRKRGHTREHDDCLDEQIKNSPARPIETFEVQINRYAVAHPNVIGQFITQKLPIALSCHAQLVEMMDGTKREFPI